MPLCDGVVKAYRDHPTNYVAVKHLLETAELLNAAIHRSTLTGHEENRLSDSSIEQISFVCDQAKTYLDQRLGIFEGDPSRPNLSLLIRAAQDYCITLKHRRRHEHPRVDAVCTWVEEKINKYECTTKAIDMVSLFGRGVSLFFGFASAAGWFPHTQKWVVAYITLVLLVREVSRQALAVRSVPEPA